MDDQEKKEELTIIPPQPDAERKKERVELTEEEEGKCKLGSLV